MDATVAYPGIHGIHGAYGIHGRTHAAQPHRSIAGPSRGWLTARSAGHTPPKVPT